MSNVRQFAALNTKIRGMVGKLLTREDYQAMLLLDNEKEIFDYLIDHTSYRDILLPINEDLSIGTVEEAIKNHNIMMYRKISCYITGSYQKLFNLLMKRFEAEDIKAYLRGLVLNEDISELYRNFQHATFYSKLNYRSLSESNDLTDFVEQLKGTSYYKVLKLYLSEERDRMLFYMEMNIDRIYFAKLAKEIKQYKGDEKAIFEVFQMNIDFLNFQWIYRGRKFYHLSSEEILNYTLPEGHYLKYDALKALSYAEDITELFDIMSRSHYKSIFMTNDDTERYLERDMDRYLFKHLLKSERASSLNMIPVIVFTHRLEFEMRDLFTMIEAKHYGVSHQELKQYLIREL